MMASNEQQRQRQQQGSSSQQASNQSQAPQISAADLANALSFATMTQGINKRLIYNANQL